MARRNGLGSPWVRIVPWAVLLVALFTTGVLFLSLQRLADRRIRDEFRKEGDRLDRRINDAFREQASILQATAGLIGANPELSKAEFATYFSQLDKGAAAHMQSVLGISLVRPWDRRAELERIARERGVRFYDFRPTTPRPEAHAIILALPDNDFNRKVPGFDMHADPTRRKAMDLARDTGRPSISHRVTLIQDAGKSNPAVLIYYPLYGGGPPPQTLAERRARLQGFVYTGLRASDLFSRLRAGLADHVGFEVWSGERDDANRLYQAVDPAKTERSNPHDVRLSGFEGTIKADLYAYEGFGVTSSIRQYVLPVGGLISVMLFLLAASQLRSHAASVHHAAEQGLLGEIGRLTAESSDDDSVLADATQAVARFMGAVVRVDLLEPDGSVRAVSTRTEGLDALAAIERDRPRLEGDPYMKAAIATGETQRGNGYEPRDETHRERLEKLDIGSVVVAPMLARGRALGAMTLTRRRGRPPLSNEDVALVEDIAARIALAVDNARLYRAAQQEIGERAAAEAEVRRLNDGLEEIVTERTRDLEASNHELESFCYSVSHDLRTPLRSLDGFGRALQEDYGERLDEQGLDYIDRIRAATKRMDELITALLTLSRLTRREIVPAEVDVSAAARDLMHDLDPEGKVALEVAEGLRAHADPRMLNVVLENLLANAIKFSSRTENPRVEVGRAEDGAIYVRDNGAGFDPQYAAKLFQPFERLHSVREFPGHGIGLATVERILKRHGGGVRAEGRPGEGATFYVRFPAKE